MLPNMALILLVY